eukprot:SM000161S02435  [mRNA]  locus=s161:213354:216595:+ [translate_table: standard]
MAPPPTRLLLALLPAALLAAAAAQSLAGCPWHMLPAQAYLDPAAAPLRQAPWLPQASSRCLLWARRGLQPQCPSCSRSIGPLLPPNGAHPRPALAAVQEGKYLLAVCVYGRASNQVACMEHQLLLAALLNRTLVVDRSPLNAAWGPSLRWDWDVFFDVKHAEACYGPHSVISLEEYRKRHPEPQGVTTIHEVICYTDRKDTCDGLGTELGGSRKDLRWPARFSRLGYSRTGFARVSVEQFKAVVGVSQARLLTLGDLYGGVLTDPALYAHPFGPIRRTCKLPLRPHPAIIAAAEGFVNTFLGDRFLAVHLRRNDFWAVQRLCAQPEICYWPIPEVARFIQEKAKRINATVVLLASDAHPLEDKLLRARLGQSLSKVSVVRVPRQLSFAANGSSSQKLCWLGDAWKKAGFEDGSIAGFARMALEKVICSMSAAFLGTAKSTFSLHIIRMRLALGHHSCKDRQLGEGWDNTQPQLPVASQYLSSHLKCICDANRYQTAVSDCSLDVDTDTFKWHSRADKQTTMLGMAAYYGMSTGTTHCVVVRLIITTHDLALGQRLPLNADSYLISGHNGLRYDKQHTHHSTSFAASSLVLQH